MPDKSRHVCKVYVVEDDAPTRAHLLRSIRSCSSLKVCGEAGTLADAQNDMGTAREADLVLVDLGLPDGDGTDFITALTSEDGGAAKVLVISVFGDERRVIRAIEAGASGYLLKDEDERTLKDSLLRTLAGECPVSPAIARHLLRRFRPCQPAKDCPLTNKEVEVLKLLSRGFGNAETAELLGISINTLTTHTKNIYRKLAVRSRSEAIFEASQMGVIELVG